MSVLSEYLADNKKRQILFCIVCIFLFGLAAHAASFFGMLYSHDSLLIYQNADGDDEFQYSIGRFLQPAYRLLRGHITAPWLIGMLSLIFLTVAVILVVKTLDIRSAGLTALMCGLLTANTTMTFSYATYMPWCDVYMLCFALTAGAVYLFNKYKYGFIPGALLIAISLALYQSYISVAVGLLMILVIKDILNCKPFKTNILTSVKALLMTVGGGVLYLGSMLLALHITGIEPSTKYNGIAQIFEASEVPLIEQIRKAYEVFFDEFFLIGNRISILQVVYTVIVTVSVYCVVSLMLRKKVKPLNVAFTAIIVCLLPLGMNCICVLSGDTMHSLMTYGCLMIYVLAIYVIDASCRAEPGEEIRESRGPKTADSVLERLPVYIKRTVAVACAVIIGVNVVFANQMYTKKELQYTATLSIMTRLVDRMDSTEGYEPGKTPVLFVGSLSRSAIATEMEGFEDVTGVGAQFDLATTYTVSNYRYFRYVLGYPLVTLPYEQKEEVMRTVKTNDIPVFPEEGCCVMREGYLFVRLS